MGIVKYIDKDIGGKKFNCGQALKDGWGLDWKGEKELIGLKLQNRKRPKHKEEIANVDWFVGTLRIHFKSGGWQCFDHCIEQFNINLIMEQKECILCAAIDYNGIIICGHRHGDCYATLKALVGDIETKKLPDMNAQGFLTSINRYVGREEAWKIAKENNQIKYGLEVSDHENDILLEGLNFKEKPKTILISENLY